MIIAITGDVGSGKTLGMTALIYGDYKDVKTEVYSNYGLSFPHTLLTMDKIESLFEKKLEKPTNFAIDEAHIFMDSRSSSKNRNKLMTYWVLQTRKRKINLFFTTQFFGQVDKRLRDLVDYEIKCENIGTKEEPIFHYELQKRIAVNTPFDFQIIKEFTIINVEKYYKLFDTYEIINPFGDDKK